MRLRLVREIKGDEYTIGRLYVDGDKFCDTLEDKDRGLSDSMSESEISAKKVKGETAIPTGTYQVTLDVVSPRFASRAQYAFCGGKLPRLLDVPCWDGVLIHIGNYVTDTEGCVLVGKYTSGNSISNSTATFRSLYEKLLEDKENITIEIV